MNKVTTISLAGNAYQVEEAGYERLTTYLADARAALAGNPDAEEIIRDLEAAIGEKLARRMGPHANVASEAQVAEALEEMGPVDPSAGAERAAKAQGDAGAGPKRLYNLPSKAVVCGVCAGIAAYFDLDPTVVRLAFVAATLLTGGGWILFYAIMAVFVPYAKTPEEEARAAGAPFTAEEVVARAKEGWAQLKKSGAEWKRSAREEKRRRREEALAWRRSDRDYGYRYYRHGPTFLEELIQLAIVVAILAAVYAFIPETRGVYHALGADIQQAWAWLNARVAR
ncbi:MAG: PspC domain-containing protein [Patescibacteria group bacterium]|nr:PspC domain-containing protein [Patescibacteria group bacterium]